MKKVLLGLLVSLVSIPLFAAELAQGRDFQEHSLFLDQNESVVLVATGGKYEAYWHFSKVTITKVKETTYEDLYVVEQTPLYHIMIMPSWPKKVMEDKDSVVIHNQDNFKSVRILVPKNLKLFLDKTQPALEPVIR